MNKNLETLKITKENIKAIKMDVKRLFGITEEDLEYRKFFIEIKEPSKAEDIVVCNDYRDSECGMLDGKKYVTFYFCNKDFTTIEDEDTIHVQIIDEHAYYDESGNLLRPSEDDEEDEYVIDKYENKYNIDLTGGLFIVLYEYYDFNNIGDYVVEIYPLI